MISIISSANSSKGVGVACRFPGVSGLVRRYGAGKKLEIWQGKPPNESHEKWQPIRYPLAKQAFKYVL